MTTQLIEYNVTQAAIAELTQEKETLLNASELDYKAIKDAKNRNGKIRIAIEKKRKDLKSVALAYGKKIDNKAKEVSEPVTVIEDAYKDVLNKRDAELEAVRVAEEQKEQDRIHAIKSRIESIIDFKKLSYSQSAVDIQSDIDTLKKMLATGCEFNYSEFLNEAADAIKDTFESLDTSLKQRVKFEAEQAEQEVQRKKDNEARIALQAEKDAFEQEQKDAQAKIDFELASIQKEKDDLKQAKIEREEKRQQEIHDAKMKEAEEQLAKQRAIDDENRKKAEETERLRLEQIAKEEDERKVKQAAEDRVRNAAPELMEALEGICAYLEKKNIVCDDIVLFNKIQTAIKLAKGE